MWLVAYHEEECNPTGGSGDDLDYGDIAAATPHDPNAGEGYANAQRFRVD